MISVSLRPAVAVVAAACALVGWTSAARAQDCEGTPGGAKLNIVVEGVRSAKGEMAASLYGGDKSQFLVKNGALKVWRAPTQSPITRMCIWLKGPGTYALAIYHDANGNQKWDHSLMGYFEDFGFSNNPSILFSAPPFDSVSFQAAAGVNTLHVRLRGR
jgi:uncharacterized protein (DUF2141 family)